MNYALHLNFLLNNKDAVWRSQNFSQIVILLKIICLVVIYLLLLMKKNKILCYLDKNFIILKLMKIMYY